MIDHLINQPKNTEEILLIPDHPLDIDTKNINQNKIISITEEIIQKKAKAVLTEETITKEEKKANIRMTRVLSEIIIMIEMIEIKITERTLREKGSIDLDQEDHVLTKEIDQSLKKIEIIKIVVNYLKIVRLMKKFKIWIKGAFIKITKVLLIY